MTTNSIHSDIQRLATASVICVGDVMLDRFMYGRVTRISPEAPVPVIQIEQETTMLGGAGNAVRSLCALGAQVTFLSVAGVDGAAETISTLLQKLPSHETMLAHDKTRKTSVKTRYIAEGQQLLRADSETVTPLSPNVLGKLLSRFEAVVSTADVVLLSDYAKGVLSDGHALQFIEVAKRAGRPVIVDPKGRDFRRYLGATLVKPNLREFTEVTGISNVEDGALEAGARELMDRCGIECLLITRGPAGMMLVPAQSASVSFPSVARELYDVSGAGDTVAAVLAAGMGAGISLTRTVELANVAAGIAVGKVGTAVVDGLEIAHALEQHGATGRD